MRARPPTSLSMPTDRELALGYGMLILIVTSAAGAHRLVHPAALLACAVLSVGGCWCALRFLRWAPGAVRAALAGPPSARADLAIGLCAVAVVRLAAGALANQVPEMFQLAIALLMTSLTGAGIIILLELLVNESRAAPSTQARPSTRHRAS